MITDDQRRRFAADGFLVIPGVVPAETVEPLLRAVNSWFVSTFDRARLPSYASSTFAPELTHDPVVHAVACDTPAFALAEQLVGRPLVPPSSGQLALRFPTPPGTPRREPVPHIDGLPSPHNGVPSDGQVHGFTLLLGVLLSDVPGDGHGAFTVWPGTHRAMASWFAEHGTEVPEAKVVYDANVEVARATSAPVAIGGRAGDIVIAHHLLLHTVGPHEGPNVRYAAFFRLHTEARPALGDRVLTDVWAEWDGVRAYA